jgi:hypothetical protein
MPAEGMLEKRLAAAESAVHEIHRLLAARATQPNWLDYSAPPPVKGHSISMGSLPLGLPDEKLATILTSANRADGHGAARHDVNS